MDIAVHNHILQLLPQIGVGAFAKEQERLQKQSERVKTIGGKEGNSGKPTPVRTEAKIGRNDMVTITNGTETKELKYKKAEPLIESGEWRLVQ